MDVIEEKNFWVLFTAAIADSKDAAELCRKLIHDSGAESVSYASFYRFDGESRVFRIAGYGVETSLLPNDFSIWEDNDLASAMRSKSLAKLTDKQRELVPVWYVPAINRETPVGGLGLCFKNGHEMSVDPAEARALGSLLGSFLNIWRSPAASIGKGLIEGPDELTTRQVTILKLIGDGMTNAEISKNVLVSESTVRQETIKIYRALGVGGRIDAVKVARQMGLLPKLEMDVNQRDIA